MQQKGLLTWLPSKKGIDIPKLIIIFIFWYIYRVAALELGPKQIRVNAVNPTVTMTAMAKVNILIGDQVSSILMSTACLLIFILAFKSSYFFKGWLVRPRQGRTNAGQDSPGQVC